jgi:hypothetical protein
VTWIKEFHGAKDFGFRRDDNLGYVGKTKSGHFWQVFIRSSADKGFTLLSPHGWADEKSAMADADKWIGKWQEEAA